MTTQGLAGSSPSTRSSVRPLEPDPPAWVHDLFGHASIDRGTGIVPGLSVATREPYVWLRARVTNATLLKADDLSARVADRYRAMHAALQSLGMHPIRFWNYVPGIVDRMDGDIDRYMAFNRGRHQACAAVTPSGGETRASATASAVGVDGPDLVIDCLASTDGGSPVENPRQITSWRYSRRYGPRPPFFARGIRTTLDERPVLLLGGTASIVGEDSCHVGNVAAQIDELLTNMAVLIAQTGDRSGRRPVQADGSAHLCGRSRGRRARRVGDRGPRRQSGPDADRAVADLPARADGRSRRRGGAWGASWRMKPRRVKGEGRRERQRENSRFRFRFSLLPSPFSLVVGSLGRRRVRQRDAPRRHDCAVSGDLPFDL